MASQQAVISGRRHQADLFTSRLLQPRISHHLKVLRLCVGLNVSRYAIGRHAATTP
jgi:hypothetical protein